MNRLRVLTRITILSHLAQTAKAFSVRPLYAVAAAAAAATQRYQAMPMNNAPQNSYCWNTRRSSSSLGATGGGGGGGGGAEGTPQIRQIGKDEMEQIIEDYEHGGREDSGYVVLDVRGEDEVMMTGKVSPKVITLPLPVIMAKNVFAMDEEEFEEFCGFEKPELDETLVFTCAAGIRSQQAAFFAAQAGYGNLVNYMGGAKEWF